MAKKVAAIIVLVIIALPFVAGCTTQQIPEPVSESLNTSTTSVSTSASVSASAKPSDSASIISPTPKPTPSQLPTPTPVSKLQCNHVDISVNHPINSPCMMCAERFGHLSEYATQHTPYVTATFVGIPMGGNMNITVSATERETGKRIDFDSSWSNEQIMAWVDSVLTCK